jgi:hypothetical protein
MSGKTKILQLPGFVEVGGLMSYGANFCGFLSRARYLCRPYPQRRQARGLARGVQSSKFEMIINAETGPCLASPCRRCYSPAPTR